MKAKTPRLKTFKLCGRTFKVKYTDQPVEIVNEGICTQCENQILIWARDADKKANEMDCVFHEFIEAANAVMGLELEHGQIYGLAAALQQFYATARWEVED